MTRAGFVGRADELGAVRGLLEQAGPGVALIVGEPGMGKTRLLAEALRGVDRSRTMRIAGYEPERRVPLAGAADLLRALTRAPSAGDRLRSLLDADPDRGGDLQPLQVFESAHAALAQLPSPVVVFDDLQWADDMSVALCSYLVRAAGAESQPLLLVCASRPGPQVAAFAKVVRSVLDDDAVVDVALGPLDAAAAVALATETDPTLRPAEAAELCRAAQGSPFWIEALARWRGHPERHDAVVSEQLRAIGADPAECLAAMVVAARPVRRADLATILQWAGPRVDEAVAALVDRGLVTPDGAAVAVSHDLVREASGRQIADAEQRRLQLRVAAWLSADADADLPRLLEALERQSAVGTPSGALALRIATSPSRRLLGPDGVRRFAEISDAVAPDDPNLPQLAPAVAVLVGEIGDRAAALERCTALVDRLPSPLDRARAALDAARHAIDLGRSAEATALLGRARAQAGDDPWVQVEAEALDHARRVWIDRDMAGGAESMRRAVSAARRAVEAEPSGVDGLDPRARRAYEAALTAERDVALVNDDLPQLKRATDERVAATRGLGEEHLVAQTDVAATLWHENRYGEAATRLSRVLDEARAQARPALTAEICHVLAFTRYVLGELVSALALLDEAHRLEERTATPTRRTVQWVRGGLVHLVRASTHDWREGVRALDAQAAGIADPHNRMRLLVWAVTCAARFGGVERHADVIARIEALEADAAAAGCARCGWEACLAAAEVLARVGEHEAAAQRLAAWDRSHPVPQSRAAQLRLHAAALVGTAPGDTDAIGMLTVARDTARESGQRLDELWILVDLGSACAGVDDDAAVEAWSSGLAIAQAIGARSEARLIQRRLRSLGVRSAVVTTTTGASTLTEREREVVRLVAGGARNAEIAASLFLSLKTVERHLSNIFAKLEVRNRAELVSRYAAAQPVEEAEPAG